MRLGDGEEFEGTRLGIFGSCGLLVPGVHDVVCCLLFDVVALPGMCWVMRMTMRVIQYMVM